MTPSPAQSVPDPRILTVPGKRLALVIGVNAAPMSNLPALTAAERDAEAIAAVLSSDACGFQLEQLLLGAESAKIRATINDALDEGGSDDELVVYFSGHAQQLTLNSGATETFLCTTDFRENRAKRDPDAYLSMRWLLEHLYEETTFGSTLLILDCCYAGDIVGAEADPLTIDLRALIDTYKQRGTSADQAKFVQRLRYVLAATGHSEQAREAQGHGLMTGSLLQALRGEADGAWDADGLVTPHTLLGYLQKRMPSDQQPSYISNGHRHLTLANYRDRRQAQHQVHEARGYERAEAEQQKRGAAERRARIAACKADHSAFINDRVATFVGRTDELADICARIADKLSTGGYVTITGQAGQGKSSVLAKLLTVSDLPITAYHFIPFNPGPDHQVGLLRNLMAHLIEKYDLPELYIASDSRAALRDYLPRVLDEVHLRGGREVLLIDGLDQLEEDASGVRDLSFLPTKPPVGIVFALGTRPNDTLRPLELLKPSVEYQLPPLTRDDFDLLLQQRGVALERTLADRFHRVMSGNALYLDLVARELREADAVSPEAIIERIADDPQNIFSLTMVRLKRIPAQWHTFLKPTLGLLLASRSPVSAKALRVLLAHVDSEQVREGLQRLGGLIIRDAEGRYALFHLKLYDFLRQDAARPQKEYLFDTDEEEGFHQRFVTWCEGGRGGIASIWSDLPGDVTEQERRIYARQHYIAHLAAARSYEQLWAVIDNGTYGRAKLRHDPSTRSYVQDLDLVRQAVIDAEQGNEDIRLVLLPRLWRYSLLRCSLASQANNYPDSLFVSFTALGRQQEAIGLAEVLTDLGRKTSTLVLIGARLRDQGWSHEAEQLIFRAVEITRAIDNPWEYAKVAPRSVKALAQAQAWEQATSLAQRIENGSERAQALSSVAAALGHAGKHEQALQLAGEAAAVAHSIENESERAQALRSVVAALAQAQAWEQATNLAQRIEIGSERAQALSRVAAALARAQAWEQAASLAQRIEIGSERAQALSRVAAALGHAGEREQALQLADEAAAVARSIEYTTERAEALSRVVGALAQAQAWEQATSLAQRIEITFSRVQAFSSVVASLGAAGEHEQALRLADEAAIAARGIKNPYSRAQALRSVVLALVQAQAWEQATSLAQRIENVSSRAQTLSRMVAALAQIGERDRALQLADEVAAVARGIENAAERAQALSRVVATLAQAQAWEQATSLARRIADVSERAQALSTVVAALGEAGEREQALQLADEAVAVARGIANVSERSRALRSVAAALAQAQAWKHATSLAQRIEIGSERARALRSVVTALAQAQAWEQATSLAQRTEGAFYRVQALSSIVPALGHAGKRGQALRLANEAAAVARDIENPYSRAQAMRSIVMALARMHAWEQATSLAQRIEDAAERVRAFSNLVEALTQAQAWEQAISLAQRIKNGAERAQALRNVVVALARAHAWEQATSLVQRIKNASERVQALSRLLLALAQAGEREQALQLADEAAAVARGIENTFSHAQALSNVAGVLGEAGEREQALRLADEAAAVARSIENATERSQALGRVVGALAQAQAWEQATSLAQRIEDAAERARALSNLVEALTQAQAWEQATTLAHTIENASSRAQALSNMVAALSQTQNHEELLFVIEHAWKQATSRSYLLSILALARSFIITQPELGAELAQTFDWVTTILST